MSLPVASDDRLGGLRGEWPIWVFACLPYVLLVGWFWNRGPGLSADDYALYIMHAEALVEGRPYADTPLLRSPLNIALIFQPPGLPLLLAAVMKVTGGFHWVAIKLAMAMVGLVAVLAPALYVRRRFGLGFGLGTLWMLSVAWGPEGVVVGSDLGLVALAWTVLFVLDRERPLSWSAVGAVFFMASYAMTYRLLGVALGPTLLAFGVLNVKRHGVKPLVPAAIWASGAVVVALLSWQTVAGQVMLDPARVLRAAPFVLGLYGSAAAEAHLYPLPGNVPNDLFHMASLALAVIGFVRWARASWRSAGMAFLASYGALLFAVYAREGRYLMPLAPFLIVFFLVGARDLASRLGVKLSTQPIRGTALSLWIAALVSASAAVRIVVTEPRTGGYLTAVPETQALFDYLASEGGDVRVSFAQPRVLAWATGTRSMELPEAEAERALPEFRRLGITHVILDRLELQPAPARNVAEMIANNRCLFEESYENALFVVYRMLEECPDAGV